MKHSLLTTHYYRYQESPICSTAMKKTIRKLFQLSVIGRTPQGRDILGLHHHQYRHGKPEDKPAYYMEANIHAGEVTGSMGPSTSWTP